MQRSCTETQRALKEKVMLGPPVLLGEKLENVGSGVFSQSSLLFF